MIPCQDSPSVKATYSAEIKAPPDLTVLMSGVMYRYVDGLNIGSHRPDVSDPGRGT